jgi:hypothetical protein
VARTAPAPEAGTPPSAGVEEPIVDGRAGLPAVGGPAAAMVGTVNMTAFPASSRDATIAPASEFSPPLGIVDEGKGRGGLRM